jgi:hypothetical protein
MAIAAPAEWPIAITRSASTHGWARSESSAARASSDSSSKPVDR